MNKLNNDWIQELKTAVPEVRILNEGGFSFILIKELALPEGCVPKKVDALLCVDKRDGYDSRLYLSKKITGNFPDRNWNGNIMLLDKNWHAISWKTKPGLTYFEMLTVHLNAFRDNGKN